MTPGLMHPATRLGLIEVSSATETIDHAAKAGAPGAGFDVQYAINPNSVLIDLGARRRCHSRVELSELEQHVAVRRLGVTAALVRWRRCGRAAARGGVRHDQQSQRQCHRGLALGAVATAQNGARYSESGEPLRDAHRGQHRTRVHRPAAKCRSSISTNRESDLVRPSSWPVTMAFVVVIVGGAEAWRVADQLAAAKGDRRDVDLMANLPASFDELGAIGQPGAASQSGRYGRDESRRRAGLQRGSVDSRRRGARGCERLVLCRRPRAASSARSAEIYGHCRSLRHAGRW